MGKVTQFPRPWIKNEDKDHARQAGLKTWELTHYLLSKEELPNLSPYARLVALKLADHRSMKNGGCYPSRMTLAEELNLSPVTISNCIAELMGMSDLPEEKPNPFDDESKERRKRTEDSARPKLIRKFAGTGVPGVNTRYIFNYDLPALREVLDVNDIQMRDVKDVWKIPKCKRGSRKIKPREV